MTKFGKISLLAALLLLPVMISNGSLWMDELYTTIYANEPSLSAWWQHLLHDMGADCQMPLALFIEWLVSHTIGSQEWQLRAMNVLWGAIGLLAMYRTGKRLQLPGLPLLLAIQPYFWFYTNEARPYALELACGAWLLAGLTEFITAHGAGELWAWEFSIAAVILCLTTMLAPLAIGVTAVAAAIIAFKCKWKIHRKPLAIMIGAAITMVPLAFYYFSTLTRGTKGAEIWHVDIKFFAYVVYELTGMVGLGPSIESLRDLARSPHLSAALADQGSQFVLPVAFCLALLAVFIFGLRQWTAKSKGPVLFSAVFALTATSLMFVAAGLCLQKAFWARHFAPLVPFYVLLLGAAISGMLKTRFKALSFVPVLLIGLLIFSSLNLRFGPQHRKEDYRQAAQIARTALAENKSVWWVATYQGAKYYHVNYSVTSPEPGKVFCTTYSDVTQLPLPDMIICSKPDVFDASGKVQNIIRQNKYRSVETLSSFVIWSK